ncbi:MAG TPA: patatin-like phospholipase family protein [Gemmatimonadales bacterium]|jgi:NTE family protein|nr:patatin-like phospholipase family protein [Gemmatimonadales bacterium]
MAHTRYLLSWLLLVVSSAPAGAQQCPPGPLALVLSGGGAKGFAQIGALRVLDSLAIRPDLVVGSSIGAVVGALYAGGMTARQIDSLTRILPLFDSSPVIASRLPHEWGSLPPAVLWEQGVRGLTLTTGGMRELQTNALLDRMLLRANLQARGDFDRLPIPFRAVATNLRNRRAVVLKSGDLAQAVRASIAVPLVFAPERIESEIYADGSISASLPIAVARAAGAKRIIAVDLRDAAAGDSVELTSPGVLAGQLANFLFTQPLDSLGPDDVYIWPDVNGVANLRFNRRVRDRLLVNGRAAADSALRKTSCFPQRSVAVPLPLPARLTSWTVVNGTPTDAETMGRVLGLSPEGPLHVKALEAQLGELAHIEAFRELWLGPVGAGDSVAFRAQVIRAAPHVAALGLAYDHDLGGRLWVGGLDRVLFRGIETSGVLTLGRYRSDFTGMLLTHLGVRRMSLSPLMELQLRAEDIRQFRDNSGDFDRLPIREAIGQAGLEWARLGAWRMRGTGGLVSWRTPEGENLSTAGLFFLARTEPGVATELHAEAAVTRDYRFVLGEAAALLRIRRLTLTPGVRVGVGRELPVQTSFEFGGVDGFPGLAIAERRGDRELVARVQSALLVRDPVSVRLLVAAGRSATGGDLFDRSRWLGGVRAGLYATTPIGPMAFEYGVASNGRRAAFIRVGRWF